MRLLAILLAAILSGCASKPPLMPLGAAAEARWRAHIDAVLAQPEWIMLGRAAIRSGQQGWSATLHWQQHADNFAIRVLGPLGQGAAWLRGDAGGVTLQTAERETLRAVDAESLLYSQFGWEVPVSGLRYWLRGVPDPALAFTAHWDEQTRLTELHQAGWTIRFQRYVRIDGLDVPDKLSLENPRFSVRVVVQDWQAAALQP